MKITKSYLKEMIKQETSKVLREMNYDTDSSSELGQYQKELMAMLKAEDGFEFDVREGDDDEGMAVDIDSPYVGRKPVLEDPTGEVIVDGFPNTVEVAFIYLMGNEKE